MAAAAPDITSAFKEGRWVKDNRSVFVPFYQENCSFPRNSTQQASLCISRSELGHVTTPSCKRNWSVPASLDSEVKAGHGEGVTEGVRNAQRTANLQFDALLPEERFLIGLVSGLLVWGAPGRAFT